SDSAADRKTDGDGAAPARVQEAQKNAADSASEPNANAQAAPAQDDRVAGRPPSRGDLADAEDSAADDDSAQSESPGDTKTKRDKVVDISRGARSAAEAPA